MAISMDGRGRALDNVFVERLWRSVKYEEVYLKDYTTAGRRRTRWPATFASTATSGFTNRSATARRRRSTRGGARGACGIGDDENQRRSRAQKMGEPTRIENETQLQRPRETWEGSRGPLSPTPTP